MYPGEERDIVSMLRLGAERVHIRKPGATDDQMARLLEGISPEYRLRLSVHDCFETAVELGVGGLHLNSRNSVVPPSYNGLISRSCHSIAEAAESINMDYVFLSPAYPSISKPGYGTESTITDEFAASIHSGMEFPPVFALGGVRPRAMKDLEAKGFCGAALLGAAWTKFSRSDFNLQYITPSGSAEFIASGVAAALQGGCRWIQLRMKDARSAEIIRLAAMIEPMCRAMNAVFLLDDRIDLVKQCSADGVHLGKNDIPVAQAKSLLGPGYIVGATANTLEDALRAVEAGADYIGLGPFRFTGTKKNLAPLLGIDGYRAIVPHIPADVPVVAIGGLLQDDIQSLAATGVGGVAVSGAIASTDNPELTAREFKTLTNKYIWTN